MHTMHEYGYRLAIQPVSLCYIPSLILGDGYMCYVVAVSNAKNGMGYSHYYNQSVYTWQITLCLLITLMLPIDLAVIKCHCMKTANCLESSTVAMSTRP